MNSCYNNWTNNTGNRVSRIFPPADVDECTVGTHNCHGVAHCYNNQGSFRCECWHDYTGDGISVCDPVPGEWKADSLKNITEPVTRSFSYLWRPQGRFKAFNADQYFNTNVNLGC